VNPDGAPAGSALDLKHDRIGEFYVNALTTWFDEDVLDPAGALLKKVIATVLRQAGRVAEEHALQACLTEPIQP